MGEIVIKDWYEHEHEGSVFVIFTKKMEVHWCFSGNELRRVYLQNPEEFISEPIEVAIPEHLTQKLRDYIENW